MSTDKEEFALYCEAKNDKVRKRLGIKGGFYWTTAKKLSVAISRCITAMDDNDYDEDDFKKPVRVHLPVVNDLPPEGVFDTEFCNRYEKGGEDGITMVFIAPSPSVQEKPASTDNTNVNGEDMTEIEENMLLPVSGQELPIRWLAQHGSEKPVTHVAREELQALHIARAEELPAVTALAISHNTKLLDPLEIRDLHKLARDTDKVFPNPGNSDLGLITAFFEAYLDADYTDRGLLTKEWMKGNRVSRITRTASGANAGGGNKTDRNPNLVHTFDTLDVEIAAATLPMDFNIYEIPGSVYRRAKEIVLKRESPFKEWSAALRATPGILDYSRAAIFALIRSAHPEFYHYPGRLQGYINAYLTETDHENPSKETLTAARHTPEKDILEEVNRELAAKQETEEEENDEEKPQPSCAMADEQATAETVEPDATEHHQDTQPLDAQSQVNSVDAKYQKLRAELHEARKNIPPQNPVDADKLLAASRGEFVEGISDPNDPKWIKGIQTRDSVYQNQPETEQNDQKAEQNSPNTQQNEPETKQPEPVVQQEPEKICTACGQRSGGNCPDCGAVMGDATYQETFDDKNLVEVQEDDSEKMEGAEHPHKENAGSAQDHASDSETGETADPLITVNGHRIITSTSRTCDHLMIDLETMGKNPDAPIISIGAIFFDPQTGDMGPEFSKTIDLETAGGVIDRDTIKWWLKQSREAQSAIMTDEIPLDDALLQLREFIDENSGEFFVQVWGNGANFDNTILRRSYERQGIPCPWRYYNDRDVRTIVELGKAIDFDARTAIPFEGERHNALDDARYQAKYVSVIWQKLIPSQADS
ncbi:exonuclease [Escherichia coli]|uniref:Exonuclease n=11 Tax=Enterobacteriaceae TaxID=543 RepID=A0A4D1SKF7_ECOLX|nr:Exodeoxyribonuclease VIII [Escherichia coli O145:H28 str. RM13516]AHY64973.1 Exodeoxyribonuclease VIII [Escherichia coli O145:H28 str. RM12761]EEC7223579.1 exonuclease [Escherichia coli O145]EEC9125891.1 exonuclease [Escherichia coli]EEV0494454.1 exonuclease [Escherichia coli O26]EFV9012650.1 exonuclease [Shigella sonnei]EHW18127.1 exonuclease family protein [Escherichia coli DEC8C]EIF3258587.1 3'-5' exoribonuclease [Escherichia coli O103]EIL03505.1 exonuclease [Escherichia coli O111:H11